MTGLFLTELIELSDESLAIGSGAWPELGATIIIPSFESDATFLWSFLALTRLISSLNMFWSTDFNKIALGDFF